MEPFLGLIKLFPYGFAPKGWLLCDGRSLTIQQFTALYSLLGVKFGGNASTTFFLPNLTNSAPITATGQPTAYYIATEGIYPTKP
jgi:microcystin-dependent protein